MLHTQCLGLLHTKSKHTCSKCRFNIYYANHAYPWLLRYEPRSVAAHREYGGAWLQTRNQSEMKAFEDEHGFRWTALLNLPYVDTISIHTVEPFVRLLLFFFFLLLLLFFVFLLRGK